MTPRIARKDVRKLVEWAEGYGWRLDDTLTGTSHFKLVAPSGEFVTLPSTPGEYRSLANSRATIRRISGIPSESGPAGRYRHTGKREHYDMTLGACESQHWHRVHDAKIEAMRERHAEMLDELARIREKAEGTGRRYMPRARRLVAECVIIEETLARMAQPVERNVRDAYD